VSFSETAAAIDNQRIKRGFAGALATARAAALANLLHSPSTKLSKIKTGA